MNSANITKEAFIEADYLRANPDVAAAVRAGHFESGWQHFEKHGRAEGRALAKPGLLSRLARLRPGIASAPADAANSFLRFEHRAPSPQTTVDVFRGRWASDLDSLLNVSGTGVAKLFTHDDRPKQAAAILGTDGRLSGFKILELGPLEGAHTYLLEGLDAAAVIAVEANVEAYLKCLTIKEILGLKRAHFLLGDIIEYLRSAPGRFDLVFCSGVLYHMEDPLTSIRLISEVTDKCFIWTHYYDPVRHPRAAFRRNDRSESGFAATYWSHTYGSRAAGFWGGNKLTASWLERETLLGAFRHFGLSDITVIQDEREHSHGPSITFTARRPESK